MRTVVSVSLALAFLLGAWLDWLRGHLSEPTVIGVAVLFALGGYAFAIPPLLRGRFGRMLLIAPPFLIIGAAAIWGLFQWLPSSTHAAIHPALVTGSAIVLGWFVTFLMTSYREEETRERVRLDTLVALRSEIFALVDKLDNQAIRSHADDVQKKIRVGDGVDCKGEAVEYFPFSTMESEPIVFEAVAASVPALRDDTVAAVVRFYAEYTDLRRTVEDSRTPDAKALPRERRVALHEQLTKRRISTLRWGLKALNAINAELTPDNPGDISRSGLNPDITP